jgi:hypothetical protein
MTSHRSVLPVAAVVALAALGSSPARAADPLGPVEPTADEQAAIYALNRGRSDPVAYGTRLGLDFSQIAPQPPLAVNKLLVGSARFHAKEMLDNRYYGHVSAVTGFGPNAMAVLNGYDVFGAGLDNNWTTVNTIESIAKGVKLIPTCTSALNLLIIDKGVQGAGHRVHLMALHPQYAAHREIGFGRAAKGEEYLYAIHTANVSANDTFLTGVVSIDKNGNGSYDNGEGLGGVTVDAGGGRTTLSMAAGGWSIQVPRNATYVVTCSGGAFRDVASATVNVGTSSREVDFVSGRALGEIDFGGTTGPTLDLTASATSGTAPLTVDFAATSNHQDTTFQWTFGDGGNSTLPAVQHVFQTPGRVAVIAVNGPSGAGAGTTPPASPLLTVTKLKMKAGFAVPGADTVTFTGRIEMPAGWTPGLSDAVVDLAGVRVAFPLADSDKATDANGNKFALKYKAPKGGGPLAAGVVATLTVTLKGALADQLFYAGLRNVTESRTVLGVPFAVMLGEQTWSGTAKVGVKSKSGAASTGVLKK